MLQGMNTTVNILRASEAVDAVGDTQRTWGTIFHNVLCRVDSNPSDDQLTLIQGQESVRKQWAILEGDFTLTILPEDRLIDSHNNLTYRIETVRPLGLANTPIHHTELTMMKTNDERFE